MMKKIIFMTSCLYIFSCLSACGPNGGTPAPKKADYEVNHYIQQLDGQYPVIPTDHETFNDVVGKEVTPSVKAYTGFTAPSPQTVIVKEDGSTEVNYQYTRNSYLLTWDPNGGVLSGSYTYGNVLYETPIVAPTATLVGSRFIGWNATVPEKMPANSLTFVAQYEELQTATVTIDKGDGSNPTTVVINKGETLDMPDLPTRVGYAFDDWYLGDEPFDFTTQITEDITIVGHWIENKSYITSVSPTDGGTVDVLNDKVKDYVNNFEKCYSAKYKSQGDQYMSNPLTLSWTANDSFDSYIIDVSLSRDFEEYDSYACNTNTLKIENVYTDVTYYWHVNCVKNEEVLSSREVFSVYVAKAPRIFTIDAVTNTRDIGGMVIGNKRIKQGMAFRSARLDNISEKGKLTMLGKLGVKTDLDLRGESRTVSPLGEGINFINLKAPCWVDGDKGVQLPSYQEALKNEVKVFADINNYPIDFHCSIGQDRTGTLAILIEGLLGASLHDIYLDYELTSFSSVTDADDPVNQSIQNKYQYQVEPLMNYLKSFGSATDSFQTCVINFLTGTLGVTAQEISTIQSILLEDR